MKKLLLMMSIVVLISGCEEKESQSIIDAKETEIYFNCVMGRSSGLNTITPTMEKMIERKCIYRYQVSDSKYKDNKYFIIF
jgi:uncharacterized protein YpmS